MPSDFVGHPRVDDSTIPNEKGRELPTGSEWMERYIGMNVHAASCTLAMISEKGRELKGFPVETNGQTLVEAIRMIPGHKHLVFEEGEPPPENAGHTTLLLSPATKSPLSRETGRGDEDSCTSRPRQALESPLLSVPRPGSSAG